MVALPVVETRAKAIAGHEDLAEDAKQPKGIAREIP